MQALLLCVQLLAGAPAGAQDPPPTPPRPEHPEPEGTTTGRRHEIVEKRTETAKFFEEADGTYTAELYSGPIHFKDHEDKWQDIDTSLVATAENGWGWKNRAGGFSVAFADRPGRDQLVRVNDRDGGLAFGLNGAQRSRDPEVEGSTITYPEVFPGIDLKFEVRNSDVKELLVFKVPPRLVQNERRSFTFPVRAHGLRAVQQEPGGAVMFVDAEGVAQFGIPKLWMNDSSVDPRSGEPAFSDDLTMNLVERGNAQFLDVDIPRDWLLDPARVYPVYVDPTVTPNPLTPNKDTFVQSNIVNTPQNTADELKAGTYDGVTVARSLLKFDVSSLRGKTVTSAKLSLYNHWSWSCQERVVEVYRVTNHWNAEVTWPSRPGFTADRVDSKSAAHGYHGCANNRVVFENVLEPVNYWLNRPEENHGFGIRAANESDVYGWKRFHSSEGAEKPLLRVTYEEPANQAPLVPTDLSPIDGSSGDATPDLKARYRDPDPGDGGYVKYWVYNLSGGLVASGKGDFAEPGQMSVWDDFPVGKLQRGKTYFWEARGFDHNLDGPLTPDTYYSVNSPPNNFPYVPSQLDPPNGTQNQPKTPSFSALYSDPDNHPGIVHFDVWDAQFGGNLMGGGDSVKVASGVRAPWQYPDQDPERPEIKPLQPGVTYYWDAYAHDEYDPSPRTTPRYSFTVGSTPQNAPPYAPYNLQPPNNTYGGPTPTLSGTFDDPNEGDSGYLIFQIFHNGALIHSGNGSHVERGQTSSYPVPSGVLQTNLAYQWRAWGHDGMYNSNPSGYHSYTVVETGSQPPYQPTQLDPPDWHESLETQPTLSALYNDADTGDDGQVWFDIKIVHSGGSSSPWDAGWGTPVGPGQRSSWKVTKPLTLGTTYRWQAISYDGDQWGPWSVIHSYTVKAPNQAPGVPTDLSPPNPEVGGPSPRLSGRYNDPDAGDLGYVWFEIWEVVNGGRQFVQGAYSQYLAPGQMGHWDVPAGVLRYGTTYEWRAQNFDDMLQSGFTSFRQYIVPANGPPRVPGYLSPEDDTVSPNKRPTLTAEYFDYENQNGIIVFQIDQIANGLRTTFLRHESQVVTSGTKVSWTPTQDMVHGVRYEWYAFGRDATGLNGAQSAERTYWMNNAPSTPTSLSPPDGTSSTNTAPALSAVYNDVDPGDAGRISCLITDVTPNTTETQFSINSPLVAPGQRATCQFGTRKLTPGHTYKWTAAADDELSRSPYASSISYVVTIPKPTAPVVSSSTHPDQTKWYSKGADPHPAQFTWTSPATENVAEYAVALTPNEKDDPSLMSATSVGTSTSKRYDNVLDGTWWFHVVARNQGGWGEVRHYRIQVDDTAPGQPVAKSTTHSPPGVAFKNHRIHMTWNPIVDATSGLEAYRWTFRRGSRTGPGTEMSGTTLEATSSDDTESDSYWFHIYAVDRAGNKSPGDTVGPFVVDRRDGTPNPLSPTLLRDSLIAQSDGNGMEQFYPYRSFDLGSYDGWVNLRTGNLVVQGSDVTLPGKGLNTVIRHTYNSHRTDPGYHDTGLSSGWSLSLVDAAAGTDGAAEALSEVDLNTPILATAIDLAGSLATRGGLLEVADGDGTVHRFVRNGPPGTRWDSPPGVNLKVREDYTLEGALRRPTRYYLVRPDGVRYVIGRVQRKNLLESDTWHVTKIVDRNGNALTIDYTEPTQSLLPLSQLRASTITDNRRDGETVVGFGYSAATGRLESITSLPFSSPRVVQFEYLDGRLSKVTENLNSDPGQRRVTDLAYERRVRQTLLGAEERWLLSKIEDGENNFTVFKYDDGSSTDAHRVTKVCDRRDNANGNECTEPWRFEYTPPDANTGQRVTRFFAPVEGGGEVKTTYTISGVRAVSSSDARKTGGNILRIEDAGTANETGGVTLIVDTFEWTENRLTSRRNGVGNVTKMDYNDLGLLTSIDAPPPNVSGRALPPGASEARVVTRLRYQPVTSFSYEGCQPPAGSRALYCDTVADLVRSVEAEDDAKRRITDFWYTGPNLTKIINRQGHDATLAVDAAPDPGKDRVTSMTYYEFGRMETIDGPRPNGGGIRDVTIFRDYSPSGHAREIEDAAGGLVTSTFSPYGMVKTTRDQNRGRAVTMDHDVRDNLTTITDAEGNTIRYAYDFNDNRKHLIAPRGTATPGPFTTFFTYNQNEWMTQVSRPGTTSDAADRRVTKTVYNPDGTRSSRENPVGALTTFGYHPNRMLRSLTTDADTGDTAVTTYFYDPAGRERRILYPAVRAGTEAEKRPIEERHYTPQGALARIEETSSLAAPAVTVFSYDAFGGQVEILGPRSNNNGLTEAERRTYDRFGQMTKVERRLTASKWLEYGYDYDLAGNLTASTQPTGLASDGTARILRTTYAYDAMNRLVWQNDPQNRRHVVTYQYLPAGQQSHRIDNRTATAPPGDEIANPGDDLVPQRRTETRYNADYTVQAVIAADLTKPESPTIATCNFAAEAVDRRAGYDADGNLRRSRTVRGTAGCSGGETIRTKTFDYDHAGRPVNVTQTIALDGQTVSRTHLLEYRKDDAIRKSTWDGKPTAYEYSVGGYLRSATDWRPSAPASTFRSFPQGNYSSVSLGGGAVTADLSYHSDGAIASLRWFRRGADAPVRTHTGIVYDVGGLKTEETLSIETAESDADAGGRATFEYDLAGRLEAWASPFELSSVVEGTDRPSTDYILDDGGNIIRETVTVGEGASARVRRRVDATFTRSRLEERTVTTNGVLAPGVETTTRSTFTYNDLGDEFDRRSTTTAGPSVDPRSLRTQTSYDPAGRASTVDNSGITTAPDISYVYDGAGQVIARTSGSRTTFYFYFAGADRLAEETRPSGISTVVYFNDPSGQVLAEQRFPAQLTGEPDQSNPTWTWVLRDPEGNVATEVRETGSSAAVRAQRAYDPYGAPDAGGSTFANESDRSSLGYQTALTDGDSGNLLLGPRLYDPQTNRFTTADAVLDSASNMTLATDPLTGNRYLFAAANPVAFYEDGYGVHCESYASEYCTRGGNQRSNRPRASGPTNFQQADQQASAEWFALDDVPAQAMRAEDVTTDHVRRAIRVGASTLTKVAAGAVAGTMWQSGGRAIPAGWFREGGRYVKRLPGPVGGVAGGVGQLAYDLAGEDDRSVVEIAGRTVLAGGATAVGAGAGAGVTGACTGASFGVGAPVCAVAGAAVGTGVSWAARTFIANPLSKIFGWGDLDE